MEGQGEHGYVEAEKTDIKWEGIKKMTQARRHGATNFNLQINIIINSYTVLYHKGIFNGDILF